MLCIQRNLCSSFTIVRRFNNYCKGMRVDDKRLPADMASCINENKLIIFFMIIYQF